MPYRIAFTGVHGSGKSTTAEVLAKVLSKKYKRSAQVVEVEAIDDEIVKRGKPKERQLYFIAKFTAQYLYHYYDRYDYILYTSYPVVTIPYTRYWCPRHSELRIYSHITKLVPPPDLIVHLQVDLPRDYEILRQRIINRYGRNKTEELNPEYIEYIAKELTEQIRRHAKHNKIEIIEIPARLEVDERVQKIIEYLGVR